MHSDQVKIKHSCECLIFTWSEVLKCLTFCTERTTGLISKHFYYLYKDCSILVSSKEEMILKGRMSSTSTSSIWYSQANTSQSSSRTVMWIVPESHLATNSKQHIASTLGTPQTGMQKAIKWHFHNVALLHSHIVGFVRAKQRISATENCPRI